MIEPLQMSKQVEMASRIKNLKPGKFFLVSNKTDRMLAIRTGKLLHDIGQIEFTIVTREEGKGFKVAAI